MPCADLSRRFMPAPPASHLPGSKISNSFLETLSPRKREIRFANSNQSVKVYCAQICSLLNTERGSSAKARSSDGLRRRWFLCRGQSLRCGPCRAAFDGVKGKHFMRALISGDCHDRRVELPDRCDVQGATIVVKVFEGHPQNLDRQR